MSAEISGDRDQAPSDFEDVQALVDWERRKFGSVFVPSRKSAEDAARELLNRAAGRMSPEEVVELGRFFNTHALADTVRHDRFSPAFHGATIQRLAVDLELFNDWTTKLWNADEGTALKAADQLLRDRQTLPGAGRSYPTMLLYLRDPARFPVWMNATERGLRAISDYSGENRRSGLDGYLSFAAAVRALMGKYELAPQEVDALLADAARLDRRARAATEAAPSLPGDAFAFLSELVAYNSHAWFEANRDRYRQSVREPLRQVLETVAESYVVDLDPELITDVKLGKVLAAIRKRFPDEDGEYWPHYWGAFSRKRKQEDVQLYVILRPEHMRFGLYLGSAGVEERDALLSALDARGVEIYQSMPPDLWTLRFEPDEKSRQEVRVETVDDLRRWAGGPAPAVFQEVSAGDPLASSPQLVEAIGRVFRAVYPLAALAWGEAFDVDQTDPDVVSSGETTAYSFDELVSETLLAPETIEEWLLLLAGPKKQALFYGPPGSGKTWVAERMARYLAQADGEVLSVQFHPSYSYEDFIEGLRPVTVDGRVTYEVRRGVFQQFSERARRNPSATFVVVVDELNRADLGSVLGELMLLLEYRGKAVELPYSQRRFSVPRNVVVLGTMNTADRSLALVDFALRRRFHAIHLPPSRDVLQAWLEDKGDGGRLALAFFDLVQERIGNTEFAPGHSYWMVDDLSPQALLRVWHYELRPYLAEYWFEHPRTLVELEAAVLELLVEEA